MPLYIHRNRNLLPILLRRGREDSNLHLWPGIVPGAERRGPYERPLTPPSQRFILSYDPIFNLFPFFVYILLQFSEFVKPQFGGFWKF